MYRVLNKFADSLDNDFVYEVGDAYPREGFKPSIFRLEQLSEFVHVLGGPAIEKVEDGETEGAESEDKTEVEKKEVPAGDIEDVVVLGQLTNNELMELLDEKGIKYDKKARKEELIELLK